MHVVMFKLNLSLLCYFWRSNFEREKDMGRVLIPVVLGINSRNDLLYMWLGNRLSLLKRYCCFVDVGCIVDVPYSC